MRNFINHLLCSLLGHRGKFYTYRYPTEFQKAICTRCGTSIYIPIYEKESN